MENFPIAADLNSGAGSCQIAFSFHMSHATKKAKALKSLKTTIPQLFQESQKPNSNGRSCGVDLRKIQEVCALNSPIVEHEQHDIDPDGELQFNLEVIRNLNKILPVKKKEPSVDRVIRFIAAFIEYTQSIGNASSKHVGELVCNGNLQTTS
jgi:condensin complex subunit 3